LPELADSKLEESTMNKKQILEEDAAKTYNQFKVFEGKNTPA
jgi:hypothetical protein